MMEDIAITKSIGNFTSEIYCKKEKAMSLNKKCFYFKKSVFFFYKRETSDEAPECG